MKNEKAPSYYLIYLLRREWISTGNFFSLLIRKLGPTIKLSDYAGKCCYLDTDKNYEHRETAEIWGSNSINHIGWRKHASYVRTCPHIVIRYYVTRLIVTRTGVVLPERENKSRALHAGNTATQWKNNTKRNNISVRNKRNYTDAQIYCEKIVMIIK